MCFLYYLILITFYEICACKQIPTPCFSYAKMGNEKSFKGILRIIRSFVKEVNLQNVTQNCHISNCQLIEMRYNL